MEQQNGMSASWATWLSEQLGAIRESLGQLKAQQAANRQTVLQVYSQLTHRMDRLEDHIMAQQNGAHGWKAWTKKFLSALSARAIIAIILTTLMVMGHISAEQLKQLKALLP